MTNSCFRFISNQDQIVELDFNQKLFKFYSDPYSRESSGKADSTCSFAEFENEHVFQNKLAQMFDEATLIAIRFLSKYAAKNPFSPQGEFVHFFETKKGYSFQNEKNLIVASILIFFFSFLLFLSASENIFIQRINIIFVVMGLLLFFLFYYRISQKGYKHCITTQGIYSFKINKLEYIPWTEFNGEYTIYDNGNSYHFKTKKIKSVYHKYGSRFTPFFFELNFLESAESILKIIMYRINQSA